MLIVSLSEHPEYIKMVSSVIYREFNKFYKRLNINSIKECEKNISKYTSRIFIALDKLGNFMGVGSLEYDDCIKNEKYTNLSPWLTDLYIKPEYRNRGIGTNIIKYIMNYAKQIGYTELFLWTDREQLIDYYKKRDMEFLESIGEDGMQIYIFKIVLSSKDT